MRNGVGNEEQLVQNVMEGEAAGTTLFCVFSKLDFLSSPEPIYSACISARPGTECCQILELTDSYSNLHQGA